MTKKLFFLALLTICFSCDDSSTLGTDVLEGEKQTIESKEDFVFSGEVILGDSIQTYSSVDHSTYMVGHIKEDIFGSSKADIYGRFLANTNISKPDFSNTDTITLDSVVFTFIYDTIGFYGNKNVFHEVEIFELLDDISDRDSIYSNETFNVSAEKLVSKSLVPNFTDSLEIWDFNNDTVMKARPHLRLKLDDMKANELVSRLDVGDAEFTDSLLNDIIKGFHIRSTVPTENSIFALNLSTAANLTSGFNALNFYYTELDTSGETTGKVFNFLYSTITSNHFEHDYNQSLVQTAFDDPIIFDSLMFIQSLEGLKSILRIETDQFQDLSDKYVNYAELQIFIAELAEDNTLLYPAVPFVFTTRYNDEGTLIFTEDVQNSYNDFNNLIGGFGGDIRKVGENDFYKCNVTSYIKERIKEGESVEIIIEAAGKNQTPRRTVIFGAKHSMFAPKLKVTYTNLN